MISIKYSKAVICIYSDYGRRDSSCPPNKLHESEESLFAITNIELPGCIKIIDVLSYESIDCRVREWIKATHIKSEAHGVPQEIRDIVEGKKPKILMPLQRWMRGVNVAVWPGVVIPDDGE